MVTRLRYRALDAFWMSVPLFMLAMGFTFLSRYSRAEDVAPSRSA
eukprot:SAG25_NODE_3577_length_1035_cov_1.440171_1_plen_44_part_10